MPGFQTKPLTITIVSGNDSRIFPRNVMACFTHVLSQSWFWAVKIRNSPLMFLQTCAKLVFCLTQIYFLAITAWYRVYSMCFLISRNAILGFRKNMSQCLKGFQSNLDTTIIKLSPDWFRNSLLLGSHDFCSKTGRLSGKRMQVPLSRANVPLSMAPGWQCFQLDLQTRAENTANLAPCWGSNLTWVHHLWLSQNLVSMENHYDYEVLMVEAGAKDPVYVLYNFWVLTISVRRLDAFLERECRSHWVELMYHCQWCQVGNVFLLASWKHCQPGTMLRFQFESIWHGYIIYGWAKIWFPWRITTTTKFWWWKQVPKTLYMSCITSGFSRFLFEDWTTVRKENAGPIE